MEHVKWVECPKPMASSSCIKSAVPAGKSRNRESINSAKPNIPETKLRHVTRRGYGRKNAKNLFKSETLKLVVLGTNAAGLNKKKESLFYLIN